MKRKVVKLLILFVLIVPVIIATISAIVLYSNQERVTQQLISTLNEDFKGRFELGGSHIDLFASFPYISVDLENLVFYESKESGEKPVFQFSDTYVGFDLFTIIKGDFEIKTITVDSGVVNLVQDTGGVLNIMRGFETVKEVESAEEEFNLYLQEIHLTNVDIFKFNEADSMLVEMFLEEVHSSYKTSTEYLKASAESKMILNIVDRGDTTFVKNKHLAFNTSFNLDNRTNTLKLDPTEMRLENGVFGMEGSIDFNNDMYLDLSLKGNKPNFDLLLAFAPEEVSPILENYNNRGEVFFRAEIKGSSTNGNTPLVNAEFGAADAFFKNLRSDKTLQDMTFKGYYTNGENRNLSSSSVSIMDFSARPEEGIFSGSLSITNFESPDIDMRVHSDFNLDFLAGFLELDNIQNLRGKVKLDMNFHDVIDLANPEKTLENFNEAYYTELNVEDLGFNLADYPVPFSDINIKASMESERAVIKLFSFKAGNSDLKIRGSVSDLPALIHHLDQKVKTDLVFEAERLDFAELTNADTSDSNFFDEVLTDFNMELAFESTAKELVEFKHLPKGEFFIDGFNGKLKNYPHSLHDFYADIFIEENAFKIVDFKGMIDQSDFEFTGAIENYKLWFDSIPKGDTKINIDLKSKKLQLADIFSYNGKNHVPEDYRDEEFKELNIVSHADLHFDSTLYSTDLYLDRLYGFMHIHPLKLRSFSGRVHVENKLLKVTDFGGKIGNSDFTANADFYLGDENRKSGKNFVSLKSGRLDFDELMNYKPAGKDEEIDHDSVFNIYEVPFPQLTAAFDVGRLNYHNYLIDDFYAVFRTTKNHYIYIDTCSLDVADGNLNITGYFNGSDPKEIYFSPEIKMTDIDIEKVMVKFDNFGQDAIVSDNLKGKISGEITGMVRMHTDMVPIVNESELHIDLNVIDGALENYGPMDLMAEYFTDKNLKKIRFDTLVNHIDVVDGVMRIPSMTINSTLGYVEMSGSQELDGEMEYFVRVPLKLIKQAGVNRLFKSRQEIDPEQEDEIVTRDESKRTSFINLKISGTPEDFKISTGKDK